MFYVNLIHKIKAQPTIVQVPSFPTKAFSNPLIPSNILHGFEQRVISFITEKRAVHYLLSTTATNEKFFK